MKILRKASILVLVLALIAVPNPVNAKSSKVEDELNGSFMITPMMVNIDSGKASLSISNGTASIWAKATTYNNKYCTMSVKLLKSTSSGWSEIASYSASGYGGATVSKSYSLSTSGTYLVKSVISSGGETLTTYSTSKSY